MIEDSNHINLVNGNDRVNLVQINPINDIMANQNIPQVEPMPNNENTRLLGPIPNVVNGKIF